MLTRTPLTRLPPSKGTRPASCRGARATAASPPPHLPPPGKPFRLPQVAAMPICPGQVSTACHLLSFLWPGCASLSQSPCHLDIVAVCQTLLNKWPAISSRRNPSHRPPGASKQQNTIAPGIQDYSNDFKGLELLMLDYA